MQYHEIMTTFAVVHGAHDHSWASFYLNIFHIDMKRLFAIILCLISIASAVMADEKVDSLKYYRKQADTAIRNCRLKEACNSYVNALRVYKEINRNVSEDTVYAKIEGIYAILCYQAGDYESALQSGIEVLNIYKNKETCAIQYAKTLNNLADCYSSLGNYKKALQLGLESIGILKKELGEEHPAYASSLSDLASYYSKSEKYNDAIQLENKALEIHTIALNSDHPDYAKSLSNLAWVNFCLGNYNKAIQLETDALKIRKKVLGTEHPDYAKSLNNIADYNCGLDNYGDAIRFATEALEIRKKVLGTEHPDYAKSLNTLALTNIRLGNNDEAFRELTEAITVQKKVLGTEHCDYAISLNDLALIYANLGNYNEAIRLLSESLEIRKTVLGVKSSGYALTLSNLVVCYASLGIFEEAIRLETEALEIFKEVIGTKHSYYTTSLIQLASHYARLKNYDEAFRQNAKAIEIQKEVLGTESPVYAHSLNQRASFYSSVGNYDEAIRLYTEAMEIYKKVLGVEHMDYAGSLSNLAVLYCHLGNYNKAIPLLYEYISIIRKNVLNTFSTLTVNEREIYWNQFSFALNQWIPLVMINSGFPNVASKLYDNTALFSKGLLLSTENEMTKLIQESGDDEAIQMYTELRQNRQLLNTQYTKPLAERQINCDSLERFSTDLEHQIVNRVKEFGDYTRNLNITWKDVQSKLNDNDIAVEFLSYPDYDYTPIYAALTLCKNDTAPTLTLLFVEPQLRTASIIQDTYQNSLTDALVWGPLSSRMVGKSHVYFSASGMLHSIGIEYLPSMAEKDCYRLSSTRELVTHKPNEGIKSATLFGGIDYDATYASIESSALPSPLIPNSRSTIYYTENTETVPIISKRGRSGFDDFSMRSTRYSVDSLPGSRKEIQAISALLKESYFNIQACDTITRERASEESFKGLSGQRKSLIHISTHGFYYDLDEAQNKDNHLRMMLMGDDRITHSENQSLLRCGLCFAGANQFLRELNSPANGQDEGILNALEIAQTDLRGLELVVLSACQTALGDIDNGEGVFGLQRGFKKAGAQSILMSLWKVDDDITQFLMTEFYRGWTSGMTKTAALRNAQAIVKKKYPDPRHWAAFILLDALD